MSRITRVYGAFDVTAPAAPLSLLTQALSSSSVFVEWSAVTDPSGVTYRVERSNGGSYVQVASQAGVTYTDAVTRGQTYTYRVRAVDNAGNVGPYSGTSIIAMPANVNPAWTTNAVLPNKVAGSTATFVLTASDADVDPLTFPVITDLPSGFTATAGVQSGNTRSITVTGPAGAVGSYSFTIGVDDGYSDTPPTPTGNWDERSTATGVVWAHPFESETELSQHLNPADNRDLAAPIVLGVSPREVCPHILGPTEEDDGVRCLEIMQLGATLAAVIPTASVTTWVYAAGTITPSSTTRASISLPLVDGNALLTANMGINNPLSVFKIIGGTYDGYFCNIDTTPITDTTVTFNVITGGRTPFSTSTIQTGFSLQHVAVKSLSNPYQDIVIDEHVDEVAPGTQGPWPFPTYVSDANVPADAYLAIIHDEQLVGSTRSLYKDKVTVVRKTFNPITKLTTLRVRRATVGHGDAGRQESFLTNRYFPCSFGDRTLGAISSGVDNVLVGNDITGGWTRPLAALPAVQNGMATADRGIGRIASTSGTGLMAGRTLYQGTNKVTNFRSGYYGHADYHGQYTTAAPFTPNTVASNGAYPFDGSEFWLSWKMKFSPHWITRTGASKTFFLDQYQTPDDSQIVGASPKDDRLNWAWFHNYGSYPNSGIPDPTWEPPLDEWFAIKMRIQPGHDNCMDYSDSTIEVETAVIAGDYMTITLPSVNIPLAPGLVLPSGRYPTSLENPNALDPQRTGYFDNWRLGFKSASNGGGVLAGKDYRVTSHTVLSGTTTFVVEKLNPTSTWPPSATPSAGDNFTLSWMSRTESARYADTHIELYKREASDTDWVQLLSFDWPITFNGGTSDASAGNPKGWNNFQPTGYSNIDDGSKPGSRTVWTRYAQPILSQADQQAPTLP